MAPQSKLAATKAKAAQKAVKEKVFHPQSRKAGQLERANLRKHKLSAQSSKRSKKLIEKGSSS
jgi:translation machinery-associated protein 16